MKKTRYVYLLVHWHGGVRVYSSEQAATAGRALYGGVVRREAIRSTP